MVWGEVRVLQQKGRRRLRLRIRLLRWRGSRMNKFLMVPPFVFRFCTKTLRARICRICVWVFSIPILSVLFPRALLPTRFTTTGNLGRFAEAQAELFPYREGLRGLMVRNFHFP